MAKSARSSNTKRNNRNLRKKIFGPAHDARLERLSAKLQEVASRPSVTEEKAMEVDDTTQQAEEQPTQDGAEEMEVDAEGVTSKPVKTRSEKNHAGRKEHRVGKKKERNMMVFASERARKAKMASKKKRK